MHSLMSVGFLMYLFMNDFLPGLVCLLLQFNDVLWLAWMCDECTWHHKTFLMELYWLLAIKLYCIPGPRSAVVSASDCESEGLGFESHQSHVGFLCPGRLLPRAGSAMGPVGRLEPLSRASSTSRMRLWGCCSNYLTNTAVAAVPGPG